MMSIKNFPVVEKFRKKKVFFSLWEALPKQIIVFLIITSRRPTKKLDTFTVIVKDLTSPLLLMHFLVKYYMNIISVN